MSKKWAFASVLAAAGLGLGCSSHDPGGYGSPVSGGSASASGGESSGSGAGAGAGAGSGAGAGAGSGSGSGAASGSASASGATASGSAASSGELSSTGGVTGGSGAGSGSPSGGTGSGTSAGGSASGNVNPACDASAWVYMGTNQNACAGHLGESCGWTTVNQGQGYHCQTASFGPGCLPGGMTCAGNMAGTGSSGSASGSASGASSGSWASTGSVNASGSSSGASSGQLTGHPTGLVFGPYKDTGINMNWNTNIISTKVGGTMAAFATDVSQAGAKTATLAFATGECGSENWGGIAGDTMASANVALLRQSGLSYIISTGGAAGSFTCASDAGMETFVGRWASANLIGVDFDIEAGQSPSVIENLVSRIKATHAAHPGLRFSLTLATLAASAQGSAVAQSLGAGAPDGFNVYGDETMQAVRSILGFSNATSWPSYVTVNLMTMDYGSAGAGNCVVRGAACQMGQSAVQAAYNLHDKWGVPYSGIEVTPMIGGNDVSGESFTPADADNLTQFVLSQGLAGVHYWSYDRDVDCAAGAASPTCNSIGGVGARGYLMRFMAGGLK